MNQTGDGSNLVQVRDAGSNNTFNLDQKTAAAPAYVQLEIDQDSIQRHPKAEVKKQALRGGMIAATPFITIVGAIIADWFGILSEFGLPNSFTIPIGVAVGLGLAVLGKKAGARNLMSLRYWLSSKSAEKNEAKHIGLYKFLKLDDEGNYLTYHFGARCIYPKCNGKIIVKNLPPREQYRDGLAGDCSVADNAHSYLIDYNLVATPRELDWRPVDPPSSSPGYGR